MDHPGGRQLFTNPILERWSRPNAPVVISSLIVISLVMAGVSYFVFHPGILFAISLYGAGILVFSLAEYLIHRFVYHSGAWQDTSNWRYKIHGIHHAFPSDKQRLALPLPAAMVISTVVYFAFWLPLGQVANYFVPGFVTGYALYLTVHYVIHTRPAPKGRLKVLWKNHHAHHHLDESTAFGVTSPWWDLVFGTLPGHPSSKKE